MRGMIITLTKSRFMPGADLCTFQATTVIGSKNSKITHQVGFVMAPTTLPFQ